MLTFNSNTETPTEQTPTETETDTLEYVCRLLDSLDDDNEPTNDDDEDASR
jgi:hypothetical protein